MFKKAFLVDQVPTVNIQDVLDVPNALLIDVRRPDEFVGELGHIQGSQLVTLGPELESFILKAERTRPIVFICRSGARSANATLYAMSLGFHEVYNMQGGMIEWNQAGRDVIFE